jgi:upstream activation factor subunit UAF30
LQTDHKESAMPARTGKRTSTARTAKQGSGGNGRKKSAGAQSAGGKTAKRASSGRSKAGKKAIASGRGLGQPVQPDQELAAVVGQRPLPRTQVVKKIWDYVKAEGLQDQKNRRMINADEKLRPIFDGKKKVSMFDVAKAIANHVQ